MLVVLLFTLIAITQAAPPDLTGIAALITAGIGVAGFLLASVKGRKNNRRVEQVEQAASYVHGFEMLIARLEEQLQQLRTEMDAVAAQRDDDQKRFTEETAELQQRIRDLELTKRLKEAELLNLRGQIRGFLTVDQYRQFREHCE